MHNRKTYQKSGESRFGEERNNCHSMREEKSQEKEEKMIRKGFVASFLGEMFPGGGQHENTGVN